MPYKITYLEDGGVLCEYEGVITPEENLAVRSEILGSDPKNLNKIPYLVIDYSKSENYSHTNDEVKNLAVSSQKILAINPELIIAFVVPQDLFFGMSRLWLTYSHEEKRAQLFRSREEAENWIKEKLSKQT